MKGRAYRRLKNDERRSELLELGSDLFAQNALDELSMSAIARKAGISKALLYHYFPSKTAYFEATLARAAEELMQRTAPDPDAAPAQALAASLDAYLEWIEENETAYRKLMESVSSVREARALIEDVRSYTARRLLEGLSPDGDPKVRAAVVGWLWLMDGVCLNWLEHRELERHEVHGLLLGSLFGALTAAGWTAPDGLLG